MESSPRDFDDLLLDLHLERLAESDRARLQQAMREDPALRERSDRLGLLLQPLDAWAAPPPPPNYPEKVLASVRAAAASRDSAGARTTIPFPEREAGRRGSGRFRGRDLIAAAACILLLIGVAVPGVSALQERSRRALCRNNLATVFRGITAYQASFAGALPYAGYPDGAVWLPGRLKDRPYASNSRHLFRLVKGAFVSRPEAFICPSDSRAKACRKCDCTGRDDFPKSCNLSYASLNLAGSRPPLRPTHAIAYLSDPNPLFVGVRIDARIDPQRTNSPAHRGRGQMVLTLDGQVRWMTQPVYGAHRDNLWTLGALRTYTGTEAPTTEEDVQLVPGFPASDPAVARELQATSLISSGS